MNTKCLRHRAVFAITALAIMFAAPALAYTGQKYRSQAKIDINEARAIALNAYPGRITDEELELERGGSGLRYSFDIKNGSHIQEVGVDAKSGKILENDREGPNPD